MVHGTYAKSKWKQQCCKKSCVYPWMYIHSWMISALSYFFTGVTLHCMVSKSLGRSIHSWMISALSYFFTGVTLHCTASKSLGKSIHSWIISALSYCFSDLCHFFTGVTLHCSVSKSLGRSGKRRIRRLIRNCRRKSFSWMRNSLRGKKSRRRILSPTSQRIVTYHQKFVIKNRWKSNYPSTKCCIPHIHFLQI